MDYPNLRLQELQGLDPEAEPQRVQEVLRAAQAEVVIGHEHYRRYAAIVEPQNTIVFIRHPVERTISHYHMECRNYGYRGSLLEFASIDPNHQTRLLQDLPLDRAFIGLFEDYERSVKRLNSRYGLELRVNDVNKNPDKMHATYDSSVDSETYAELKRINRKDMKMYREQLAIFRRNKE